MIRPALAALALGTLSHAAIAQQGEPEMLQLEGVAALVNDNPISFFDVRQRASMLMVTLGVQPTEQIFQELAGPALEQLVDERLQMQMAEEFELVVSEDDIARAIGRRAEQAGVDVQTLTIQFADAGISMRTMEEQIRADIAWQRIMSGRFGSRIRVSRTAIDDQMHRLEERFLETAYQVAEIYLFAPDETAKAQAQTAANSIIAQLRNGTPFESAAQQFSSASTAAAGGDMGWVTLEDLPDPLISEAVNGASQAGILEPIVTTDGVYIIAVRGKREPQEATSTLSLKQLVATDRSEQTLQSAMNDVEDCATIHEIGQDDDDILVADIGAVRITDLSETAQARVRDLQPSEFSLPFEMSRGLASLFMCDRRDGIENLPSLDQVENELFGREFNMISERELRNARLEATILR